MSDERKSFHPSTITPTRLIELFERYISGSQGNNLCWTYALYFDFGNVYLRVGYTPNLHTRLHGHMSRVPEWPHGIVIRQHDSLESAMACERYMIRTLSPYRRKPDWFLFDNLHLLNTVFGAVRQNVDRTFTGGPEYMVKVSSLTKHANGYMIVSSDEVFYLNQSRKLMIEAVPIEECE